jgi:hypothetical protein
MTASIMSGVLDLSVQALILLNLAILAVVWVHNRGPYRVIARGSFVEAMPPSSDDNVRLSNEIEAEFIDDQQSEEEWSPAEVYAAYAEFYEGLCKEEIDNLENYSPR